MDAPLDIEFDPAKEAENIAKHGVSFTALADFDFETAMVEPDDRFDYGEHRQVAFGLIGLRLFVLVFTIRGTTLRAISLRKANGREVRTYGSY
ncbi:BrnT family toxin [Amorphus sp. 3PC139-8]|uniref:BrnT family toxin n=1 Tax=Amorphus sp. 3PC139-8 TaxID=2735676 RepID=UPI00345D02B8